ncbi:MAG: hypothetical protein QOJ65_115 [Fimbriimonadaceae bacterium]|jgi:hypothetical protein|nr:hypothetical protein [Fimbriimonadaceae bacterium]
MRKLIALACLAGLAASAAADLGIYSATLTGAEEVPPVVTSASAASSFSFDTVTGILRGSISANGFSSEVFGARIHTGAFGSNGPITIDLGAPTAIGSGFIWDMNFEFHGNIGPDSLSNDELKALLDSGGMYINIFTLAKETGEIRGQIHPVPEPASLVTLGWGGLLLARRRKR